MQGVSLCSYSKTLGNKFDFFLNGFFVNHTHNVNKMKKHKKITFPLPGATALESIFLIPISLALIIVGVVAPKAASFDLTETHDFNGDGKADLLWRNENTGDNIIWLMDGTNIIGSGSLPNVDRNWEVASISDFNADRKADILWRNYSTGDNAEWLINGINIIGGGFLPTADPNWINDTGDFNGDGKADIGWRNENTGDNIIWLMDGTNIIGGGSLPNVIPDWEVTSIADFNGDGRADILWRSAGGANIIWLMNGINIIGSGSLPTADPNWSIKPPLVATE